MNTSDNDKEMELLLRKKMLEYLKLYIKRQEEKTKQEAGKPDIYDKIKVFMDRDAYEYLLRIRESKPNVADKILKYLIYALINGLVHPPIDKISIEYLERKIEGKTGKIYIKRRGELKSFDQVLRED